MSEEFVSPLKLIIRFKKVYLFIYELFIFFIIYNGTYVIADLTTSSNLGHFIVTISEPVFD